jgi:hypothetical protein
VLVSSGECFDVETKLEMVSNFADLIEIYVLEPF